MAEHKSLKRIVTGQVVKLSSPDTLKVRVEVRKLHKKYGKVIKSHKKYTVHLPADKEVKVGDTVKITETKPISKTKSWIYLSNV